MTVHDNKRLVEQAWRAYCAGDLNAALADISVDVRWILNADLPGFDAVQIGRQAMRARSEHAPSIFPAGLKQEVGSVIGEGDTVMMEYVLSGLTAKGQAYENSQCIVCKLRAGKIVEIHEYMDTPRAAKMLFG